MEIFVNDIHRTIFKPKNIFKKDKVEREHKMVSSESQEHQQQQQTTTAPASASKNIADPTIDRIRSILEELDPVSFLKQCKQLFNEALAVILC